MMKAPKKNTWKPVEIDGALFNNEFDGLIGIEECTDYDLNDYLPSNKRKRVNGNKDKSDISPKKKKILKQKDGGDECVEEENAKTSVNKKKKQLLKMNIKDQDSSKDSEVKKSKKKRRRKKKVSNNVENVGVSKEGEHNNRFAKKSKNNKKSNENVKQKINISKKKNNTNIVLNRNIYLEEENTEDDSEEENVEFDSEEEKDEENENNVNTEQVYKDDSDESLEIEEVYADSDECPEAIKIEETDMQAWNIIPLPDPIIKALQEQKFSEPTEIQSLTLPAAILGKRDILGAAETGSGKTLAFGLPILCGILKHKSDYSKEIENSEECNSTNDEKNSSNNLVMKESNDNEDDDDEDDYEAVMKDNDDDNEEIDDFEDKIVIGDDSDNNEDSDFELDSEEEKVEEEENVEVGSDSDDEDLNSEESDFEENVDGVDAEGMGCVKSINNIQVPGSHAKKPLYALILTPTRELAVQIKNHLVAASKYIDVNVAVVVGGMAAVKQERILKKGPEIVVATPGRLWELIQQGNEHLSQIDDIRYLAIDETDRMIERGHFQELHHILDRINLNEEKKKLRQNFVFSATLTLVHELPKHVIKGKKRASDMTAAQKLKKVIDTLGITNPKIVDITKGKGTSGTLTECRISCSIDHKDYYVYYFLQRHPGRTLIFCNSIGCVRRLSTLFDLLGCKPMPLHASMQQRQRLKNLDRFRDNDNGLLIATDVAARGLDIPSVEHVIHYQTPRTSESYVHRSGRTARASKEGITVLLVEPTELPNYLRLCRTLGKSEDIPLFPVQENYLSAVKQRVNLARELDKLELQVKKTNSKAGWFQKVAEDMDIIVDDKSLKYDIKEAKECKKACDFKRKQLTALLEKPVFPKGFNIRYPLLGNSEDLLRIQGEAKPQSAVDVMKNAMEEKPLKFLRKKPKSFFKSKIKNKEEKIVAKDLMKTTNNKKKGRQGKKFNKKGNK